MPRTIEVNVPAERTDSLLRRLQDIDGVVGLGLQRGASLDPQGDVVVIRTTNDGTRAVLRLLAEMEIPKGGSIVTTEPRSLIAPNYQNGINRESNETIWDEMAFLLRRETNLSTNYLLLMGFSGGVAAAGMWTETVHIVVGAMVIAPGFEPLLRIPFGWIGGPRVLATHGVASTVLGYQALAAGAALVLLILRAVGPPGPEELASLSWVRYWSSVSANGVVVALAAGAAGAVVVTAQRSVLSAGVMIALALIPAMSIAGMAAVNGEWALAGRGLLRWAVDAGAVIASGAVVLGLKQVLLHRRAALS